MTITHMNQALWQPDDANIRQSHIYQFIELINTTYGTDINHYEALHQWSINNLSDFWKMVSDFTEVIYQAPCQQILSDGHLMPGAKWFEGAKLNFAENLLRYDDNKIAIRFCDEIGTKKTYTYAALTQEVTQVASYLRSIGIAPGDRVAGLMPNIPQTCIAMLATASIGAIWSSCSPDFGLNSVRDRFEQIKPKVLFTCFATSYNGKKNHYFETTEALKASVTSIENIVVYNYLNLAPADDVFTDPAYMRYQDLLALESEPLVFEPMPFDAPLYILFSSGTTGQPKCITHSIGGTLIQHLKEHILHVDLSRQDNIFFYTTCGWMMWNWLISALATGATLTLYEGSPTYPKSDSLFDLIDSEEITVFGTSAKYLSAVEQVGLVPRNTHLLSSLRAILSTGSPLLPESFNYVYEAVKYNVQLSSISGGTDIVSCFALGCPIKPVYEGELQAIGLGMDVKIYDETGKSITAEKGELVCCQPFPSMPIGFWNDPDGTKFHDAYFSRYDNCWAHGDYAEITNNNGLIIYGRSDAVLNPSGVRIGTAEIYREVEKISEVSEAIAVGQQWDGDERIILFVILQENYVLTDELSSKIQLAIRENTSPRHVPAKILQVEDIPRTINGKIMELAVKQVIHDLPVKNIDVLANPESLEYFKNRPELSA